MKTCYGCKKRKKEGEFYKHPGMTDGVLNKCKDCLRKYAEKNRARKKQDPQWVQKEAERQRKKNKDTNHRYPEIASARRSVRSLGQSQEYHWHHWSYLKEHRLDVFKLTPKNHRKAHTRMVYDPEQMKYRTSDGLILLDTRESHELHLMQIGVTVEQ